MVSLDASMMLSWRCMHIHCVSIGSQGASTVLSPYPHVDLMVLCWCCHGVVMDFYGAMWSFYTVSLEYVI